MEFEHIKEQIIHLKSEVEKEQVAAFLAKQNLSFDQDIEYTIALLDGKTVVGTGSFAGRILKCIAVDSEYKGRGFSNRIVSHLVGEQYRRGNTHLFLYTKPENSMLFAELGFYSISEVPSKAVLMENRREGIQNYLKEIARCKKEGKVISAIVGNCNPFTLGHQHLIEYAAARSDQLNVFVVWEDRSCFPSETRYRLVKESVRHLSNVTVHKGKDYIISAATFPSYFIKEYQEVVQTHATLDLKVFAEHIAPALGINRRFIGEEPYCPVTRTYNRVMRQVLPKSDVEVVEVPRLSVGHQIVSASKVRELIRKGEFSKIQALVPRTTYEFLLSEDAQSIIRKIRSGDERH